MTSTRCAAIILAAGRSSRMQNFKPLLSIGDQTMVDRILSLFMQNDCDVILVVGWNKEALLHALKNRPVTIAENPDYDKGMLSSVQAGIRNLQRHHASFFVMPVDIPLVRPSTVRLMMDAAKGQPGKLLYPVFGEHRGHPPLIPSSLSEAILKWNQDGGLKSFLQTQKDSSCNVTVPDRHVLFDIDTPEDYAEAVMRLKRYQIPTAAECDIIIKSICRLPQNICRHCQIVSDVALAIGRRLQQNGQELDLALLGTAALLHDAARVEPNHANAASQMLRDLGFAEVGDIVAVHTDLKLSNGQPIRLEAKILFLADKLVEGDKVLSLEERYRTWNRRFDVTPEIAGKILQGKNRAKAVKHELEFLLGCSIEETITP